MTTLTLIVARASNGVIGRDNELPWRLPEDLKFFKRTTMGAPMILSRRHSARLDWDRPIYSLCCAS